MNANSSILIGNGESRKGIDLQKFTGKFPMVGCNAVHRDCIVDHLVCYDSRMVREALDDVNTSQTLIYVREDWYHHFKKMLKNRNIRPMPEIPYSGQHRADHPRNWGSGTFALIVASNLEQENIFVLGYDLYGNKNLVNNVYKDTNNYAKSLAKAVDPSYWIYQSAKVFNYYNKKKYIIVNDSSWKFPSEWRFSNVEFLSIDKLQDRLKLK